MPEPPDDLLAAVRDQAQARVRMDVYTYSSYLTPEAIESLRASFPGVPPRVSAFEIVNHEPRGVDHLFEVRYTARDHSFVVRSRWRNLEEGWRVVRAERLWAKGERRLGIISRIVGSIWHSIASLRRPRR